MFCKNCGAQINDGATFCEKCGAKQSTDSETMTQKTNDIPQTPEEILADFSGDKHGAAKYLSMRDGLSLSEARKQIDSADPDAVRTLIAQNRAKELSSCPECGSDQVRVNTETHVETQSRSFLWNLFMTVITAGIWLIWMLVRGRKEVVVETKTAVCQNCGHSWELYY